MPRDIGPVVASFILLLPEVWHTRLSVPYETIRLAIERREGAAMGHRDVDGTRRVKFFGERDLAVGQFVDRAAEIAEKFDPADPPTNATDIIELHNVQQYLARGYLPPTYTEVQRQHAHALAAQARSAVARFFSSINDSNVAALISGVDYGYHSDLLELLGRNKAFNRCHASTMLPALETCRVRLGDMLTSRTLVTAYDTEISELLLATPRNGEHLIRKYLLSDNQQPVHLPPSFTSADARDLLDRYLDSPDPHLNYVGLLETARDDERAGVDPMLKLKARRRKAEISEEFFSKNTTATLKLGCEIAISGDQGEPVTVERDGYMYSFSYSRSWLDETTDHPSVLNNVQHLFEFADDHVLLTLPAYTSGMEVLERHMGMRGKDDYHYGMAFQSADLNSLMQTRMLLHVLRAKEIELEDVIAWFFNNYLDEEFATSNFRFSPSGTSSTYLERVRHLFAEMESVATQFSLYVQNGAIDRELLPLLSELIRYRTLPTLLEGKYIYPTEHPEIVGILHTLFSDQSLMNYITDDLQAHNAAALLIGKQVAYDDFHEYQQEVVDQLIDLGVLENTGTRLRVVSTRQLLILNSLFKIEAENYYHLSKESRAEVDAMVEKGWLTRTSTLLSEPEAKYFNYFLNNLDFSNGPKLRNKYQHGRQDDREDAHFHTYVTVLRLLLALMIKINDDFCLAAIEREK